VHKLIHRQQFELVLNYTHCLNGKEVDMLAPTKKLPNPELVDISGKDQFHNGSFRKPFVDDLW
jgi:hypothetical protein